MTARHLADDYAERVHPDAPAPKREPLTCSESHVSLMLWGITISAVFYFAAVILSAVFGGQ